MQVENSERKNMEKYMEKLKSVSLNFGLLSTKGDIPMTPPEWETKKKKNGLCSNRWLAVVPVIALLLLGLCFLLVDLNIFQTEITEKEIFVVSNKTSAPSWLELGNSSGASRVEDYYDGPVVEKGLEELGKINIEDDPGFVVKFDYIDLNSKEFKDENVNLVPAGSNDTEDTLIILQNDDSGKKIFLKATSVVQITKDDVLDGKTFDQGAQSIPTVPEWLQQQIAKWTELENQEKEEKQVVTTQKNFIYSPTIPQATPKSAKVEGTTRKYNATDDSRCFSTKLGFCEGVVPYDVVQLPRIPGVNKYEDLKAVLPYFQTIIESGCSLRAREFICSLLEPECLPDSQRQAPPCKLNCKVVFDDCRDFIDQSSPLSKLFDCSRYPDWDESAENESECVNFSKGECYEEEHQCSDGTCIPLKWVCDGVHDCPGTRPSFDESDCKGCAENEFRCVLDGKCIPLHWKCDGQIDCTDHSDELSC